MHLVRPLILFCCGLVLAGCRTSYSAPDAGPVAVNLLSDAAVPPIRPLKRTVPHPKARRAPDPRVTACAEQSTDKGSLMGCLEGLRGTLPADRDAGPARVGAVRPPIHSPACDVSNWYWDHAGGSDSNTCTDAAHPCKTYAEISAREGGPCVRSVATIKTALTDDTDEHLVVEDVMGDGSSLTIQGTLNAIASGNLATVTPKSRTSGSGNALTASLGAAISVAPGLLIRNNTRSATSWALPNNLSNPTILSQPFDNSLNEVDTYTAGDSFSVMQPTKLLFAKAAPVTNDVDALVTIANVWLAPVTNYPTSLSNVILNGVRLDSDTARLTALVAANSLLQGNTNSSISFGDSPLSTGSSLFGGYCAGLYSYASSFFMGSDAIVEGTTRLGGEVQYDFVYKTAFLSQASIEGRVAPQGALSQNAQPAILYGPWVISVIHGGLLVYSGVNGAPAAGSAVSAFPGASLRVAGVSTAAAFDPSLSPVQIFPGRALSPIQLDTSVGAGGFGGVAVSRDLQGAIVAWDKEFSWPNPVPYVTPIANGGTATGTVCPNGQVLESNGSSYVCATPAACPVNLATCTTGVLGPGGGGTGVGSLCPNGQYLQSNGASNVCTTPSGGGSSCPINLATCVSGILTGPNGGTGFSSCGNNQIVEGTGGSALACAATINLTTQTDGTLLVPRGGTGQATNTAHAVMVGEGTSALNAVGPGTTGIPLVGVTGSDPVFGQAQVPGGGTGAVSFPAHTVLVGNGTNPITSVGPGASNLPLIGFNGSDPIFTQLPLGVPNGNVSGTLQHLNGGTDVTSPGATFNVLTSNGTSWVSATPSLFAITGSTTTIAPVTLGLAATIIAQKTLTAVAGHLIIGAAVDQFTATTICPAGPYNVIYGVSVDNSATINAATQITIPNAASTNQNVAGGALNLQVSVLSGSHTVFLLGIAPTTPCVGAAGTISVISTPF